MKARTSIFSTGLGCTVFVLGALYLGSCSSQPQTDSKSNWYSLCSTDMECGEALSCSCGVCTQSCRQSETCESEIGSQCIDPNTVSACSTPSAQVCVQTCELSDDCGAGKVCLGGVCIRDAEVGVEFCDDYNDWSSTARDFELLAIDKINALRLSGGECEGSTVLPIESSSLDFRLRCAARHQSRAMYEQNALEGTTPDNVSFTERMTESGYVSRGAKVIFSADSDEAHLDSILVDYCADILDPALNDLGVGKYEDRLSIFFARE